MRPTTLLTALSLTVVSTFAIADDDKKAPAAPPAAAADAKPAAPKVAKALAPLAFLEGRWTPNQANGATIGEHGQAPRGHSMEARSRQHLRRRHRPERWRSRGVEEHALNTTG